MKTLFLLTFVLLATGSQGQILKKIKDRVEGKAKGEVSNAKYEAKNKARQSAYKAVDDFKNEFSNTPSDITFKPPTLLTPPLFTFENPSNKLGKR